MVGGVHRKSRRHRSASNRARFSGLRSGTSYKSGIQEAQYQNSLTKRSKLWSMHANQDDKGCLQKAHWRSRTSSRKVWWLDNGWSQGPQRGRRIMEQSPVRCRGTRYCHSVDSILSMRNKNFSGDGLWNAIAICEVFKTSWQTGTHLMKDDSEHHSKVQ